MNNLLENTTILDFEHPQIQSLIDRRGWKTFSQYDAIGSIYTYVKDEVEFGYNSEDNISASQVLSDGYGQCNTKSTLLMALLRSIGVPTRFHGFTIFNKLQKGAIPLYLFWLAPSKIIHSWVEVYHEGEWLNLEGFILDEKYLDMVQSSFPNQCNDFSGYGVATACLKNPEVRWQGASTYIQSEGIADDYGVYDCPDEFYKEHGTNLNGLKKVLYKFIFRHLINVNVENIRKKGLTARQVGIWEQEQG